MIELAVVIEIAEPQAPPPALVSALISACTEAVTDGECALAGASPAGARSGLAASAVVTFVHADRRVARIALRVPRDGRLEPVSRQLDFAPEDAEVERWRAVGLVIATVVGQAREAESEAAEPPARAPTVTPPEPSPPPAPRPTPSPPSPRPPWLWLDAAIVAGPALEDDTWRVGAALRASIPLGSLPLFGLTSIRYAARPADGAGVSVSWLSGSLGAGAHFAPAPALGLQLRIEGVGESIAASVTEPGTDATDGGRRWMAGFRVGADAVWMAHRNVGVLAGFDGSLLQRGILVLVRDREMARAGALTYAGSVGLRVALP